MSDLLTSQVDKGQISPAAKERMPPGGWVRLGWVGGLAMLLVACSPEPAKPSSVSAHSSVPQGELIQPLADPGVSNVTFRASEPIAPTPVVPSNASPSPVIAAAATLQPTSEFVSVGFDKLSAFNFDVSDEILQSGTTNAAAVAEKTAAQIPKAVRDYDQKRISLKGFMLPLKVEAGKVTEMLIMRDQSMCCYGAVPKINEWVSVKMVGSGVKPIMDQAITLYGKLFVGEMRENGYLVGIYRIDGERVDGPSEN